MTQVTPKAATRKSRGPSPTARSLAHLRKHGWLAQVVERWNPHAMIRQDLFGFVDILAIKRLSADRPGGFLAIQATSGNGGNHAARAAKILAEPRVLTWLLAGGMVEVWSWRKAKDTGKWVLRRQPVPLEEVGPAEQAVYFAGLKAAQKRPTGIPKVQPARVVEEAPPLFAEVTPGMAGGR